MTEIYELQAWGKNEYRNINASDLEQDIKEAIIKVGFTHTMVIPIIITLKLMKMEYR